MSCVKDFNSLYPQLWRDASLNEINLPVDSREQAVNFRQRLYFCRQAMKAEGHRFSGAAQKVKIRIEFLSGNQWFTYTNDKAMKGRVASNWRLRMIPHDRGFDAILERAGYKAPEAPDRPDWERIKKDILA